MVTSPTAPISTVMDVTSLVDTVQEQNRTELSRLGSSKSLYADTEGEMEPDAVLAAVGDMVYFAADTVETWATDDVAGAFETAAAQERDHYDAVVSEHGDHEPGSAPPAVETMDDAESDCDRLGALVGWTLVAEQKASQCTGFFTGQAKPGTASTFRGFGDDYEAVREGALDALETVCDDEDDLTTATEAATSVVQAAYDDYFETLEALGVNPKPVC